MEPGRLSTCDCMCGLLNGTGVSSVLQELVDCQMCMEINTHRFTSLYCKQRRRHHRRVCVRVRMHVCMYNNSSESVHTPTSRACSTFRFDDYQLALTCMYVRTYKCRRALLCSLLLSNLLRNEHSQTDRQSKQQATAPPKTYACMWPVNNLENGD